VKGEALLFAPEFGGVVDKFRAVIAVELQNREGDGASDGCQSLESQL
jgi:hypothetical protein